MTHPAGLFKHPSILAHALLPRAQTNKKLPAGKTHTFQSKASHQVLWQADALQLCGCSTAETAHIYQFKLVNMAEKTKTSTSLKYTYMETQRWLFAPRPSIAAVYSREELVEDLGCTCAAS